MTANNKRKDAIKVDVLPRGRVFETKDDCILVEDAKDSSRWYRLSPPPEVALEMTMLQKGAVILRQVGQMFQTEDSIWYKLVPPPAMVKSYFQVMKVQHQVLVETKEALLIKYSRDQTMEWVRNVHHAEVNKKSHREQKTEKYGKIYGAGPKATADVIERQRQIAAGKEMVKNGELAPA